MQNTLQPPLSCSENKGIFVYACLHQKTEGLIAAFQLIVGLYVS